MFANRDKAALILEISGHRNESTCKNVLKLLEILLSEVRLDNDTADESNFRINQGEIKGYLTLKDYIERGLPAGNRKE